MVVTHGKDGETTLVSPDFNLKMLTNGEAYLAAASGGATIKIPDIISLFNFMREAYDVVHDKYCETEE